MLFIGIGFLLLMIFVSRNPSLEAVDCTDNQLSSLDVSRNTGLRYLDCSNNQLSSLDISNNTKMTELVCDEEVVVTGYAGDR